MPPLGAGLNCKGSGRIYIYMHTYIYIYTHIYIYIHTHTHTFACLLAYLLPCLLTYLNLLHPSLHTYINPCIHAYVHAYMHTYIHTYIHAYIHTYVNTYIHIYTHHNTYPHNRAGLVVSWGMRLRLQRGQTTPQAPTSQTLVPGLFAAVCIGSKILQNWVFGFRTLAIGKQMSINFALALRVRPPKAYRVVLTLNPEPYRSPKPYRP